MNIRLLLFDLGGVLYDIDHARTAKALNSAVASNHSPIIFSLEKADPVFAQYDSGQLSTDDFILKLQTTYGMRAEKEEILHAWNAMLIGLYPDSVALASTLSKQMPIALLSNINECHHQRIANECSPLFDCFHHVFLSYTLGMKKPDAEIFHHVMHATGYSADEILFFDDTPANCSVAQNLGMHAILVDPTSRHWVRTHLSQFC